MYSSREVTQFEKTVSVANTLRVIPCYSDLKWHDWLWNFKTLNVRKLLGPRVEQVDKLKGG